MHAIASIDKKLLDLFILVVVTTLTFFIILFFKLNFLSSIILFFIFPSIYISLRIRHHIIKAGLFSAAMVLLGIVVDYVAHQSGSWLVSDSVFSSKFLNVYPHEDVLWMFFILYYAVIFYEYFLDTSSPREKTTSLAKSFFASLLIIGLLFLLLLGVSSPSIFDIPYFYLYLGLTFSIGFPAIVLYRYPKLLTKFFFVNLYFAYVYFLQEITALKLGHWSFPGPEFLGLITFWDITLPVEELVFWVLLGGSTFLSLYEFFDDDRR